MSRNIRKLPRKHRRSRRREKKPRIDIRKKTWSFSFAVSIPLSFILGLLFLLSAIFLVPYFQLERAVWAISAASFLGSFAITANLPQGRFRVFIHELKHAVAVILSGNKVTDFHFDKHQGHVSYQFINDRTRFGPMIMLAPYFFPLFSLPAFIACLFIYDENQVILMRSLLSAALAFDLTTGYQELHPCQSDLKRVLGGFLAAGTYIAGMSFMWSATCLLLVIAGREGLIFAGYQSLMFCKALFMKVLSY